MEEKVAMLAGLFPDINQVAIRKALGKTDGNSDLAVELLLTGQIDATEEKPFENFT
jgi:hypothetical protein